MSQKILKNVSFCFIRKSLNTFFIKYNKKYSNKARIIFSVTRPKKNQLCSERMIFDIKCFHNSILDIFLSNFKNRKNFPNKISNILYNKLKFILKEILPFQ